VFETTRSYAEAVKEVGGRENVHLNSDGCNVRAILDSDSLSSLLTFTKDCLQGYRRHMVDWVYPEFNHPTESSDI
jgi:hypothetical protein